MAPVDRPTLCILALLAMGVMSGTLAGPATRDTGPHLDITTSIKLGGPIFGDRIGPFAGGQELTLTCSTDFSELVSLSWLEGGQQLEAADQTRNGITSSSLTLAALQPEDSGRRFTCRDSRTGVEKSVVLDVAEAHPNEPDPTTPKKQEPTYPNKIEPTTPKTLERKFSNTSIAERSLGNRATSAINIFVIGGMLFLLV